MYILCHPVLLRGALAIVTNVGRVAVDARASGAQMRLQGEMNLVSDMRRVNDPRFFAYGKTVWSWHPLLMSSQRRFFELNRVRQDR
jgi:hypothetical protein